MSIEDTLFSWWLPEIESLHFLDKLGFFIIIADGPFQEGVKSLQAREEPCNIYHSDTFIILTMEQVRLKDGKPVPVA